MGFLNKTINMSNRLKSEVRCGDDGPLIKMSGHCFGEIGNATVNQPLLTIRLKSEVRCCDDDLPNELGGQCLKVIFNQES